MPLDCGGFPLSGTPVLQPLPLTVSALPLASTVPYSERTVIDALAPAFWAPVVGGGAVIAPVYSDGSIWRVLGATGAGAGSVTTVSLTTANGFSGSVANATTTPAITIDPIGTDAQILFNDGGVVKGNASFLYDRFGGDLYVGQHIVLNSKTINPPYNAGRFLVSQECGNAQEVGFFAVTELTTIAAAATTSTAIQLPASAIIVAVSVRVTTVIPTATSFSVGDAGSATRYSTAAVGVAANSTDPGTKAGAFYNASAASVILTMTGGTPAANTGRVRVTIFYMASTPPTS